MDAVADEGVGRARTDESIKREGAVPGAPRLVHPLLMKENFTVVATVAHRSITNSGI